MKSGTEFALVGDIGGTNARFALVPAGKVQPEAIEVLPCSGYETLEAAVADYLLRVKVDSVREACLAVASPIRGTRVSLTNGHWSFDTEWTRKHFGWRQFKVINDFAAMALGVLHLGRDQLVKICGGPGDPARARLVIGPGTGLGVSGLVPVRDGWVPLITEGGHVDFAPVNGREMAVLEILQRQYGRVSVERILCGQGLLDLYRAHAEIEGAPAPLASPEQVTGAALAASDPLAHRTLMHFCEVLGRTAGNAALTLGSLGGVYICGGIVPRFTDFFLKSGFQGAFEEKGRMRSLMEFTPVYVVEEAYTGLLGAAEALGNQEV